MTCTMCDNQKELKKSKVTKNYKEGGLENVVLVGVTVYQCDKCGEGYYQYADVRKLNRLISSILIRKAGLLNGREVRFLRKELGYSGAMFSHLIGYTPEAISRLETGENPITEQFDRMVRYFVASKLPDRDYDIHDLILNKKLEKIGRIKLTHARSGEWKWAA